MHELITGCTWGGMDIRFKTDVERENLRCDLASMVFSNGFAIDSFQSSWPWLLAPQAKSTVSKMRLS